MQSYIRVHENQETARQIIQREQTYVAAKVLRDAGFQCHVTVYFTGDDPKANAASIVIEQAE